MFQPKPVPKLPTLIKARVPVWVLAAAIVAQAAITVIGKPSDPACKINVQRVHSSTYSSEIKKLSEVKVKVSTECVIAQSHTVFSAEIEEITANNKENSKDIPDCDWQTPCRESRLCSYRKLDRSV